MGVGIAAGVVEHRRGSRRDERGVLAVPEAVERRRTDEHVIRWDRVGLAPSRIRLMSILRRGADRVAERRRVRRVRDDGDVGPFSWATIASARPVVCSLDPRELVGQPDPEGDHPGHLAVRDANGA